MPLREGPMRRVTTVAAGLVLVLSPGSLAAQSQPPQRVGAPVTQVLPAPKAVDVAQAARTKAVARPSNPAVVEQAQKDRINAWTVGLAAGRLEGAPLQFA